MSHSNLPAGAFDAAALGHLRDFITREQGPWEPPPDPVAIVPPRVYWAIVVLEALVESIGAAFGP